MCQSSPPKKNNPSSSCDISRRFSVKLTYDLCRGRPRHAGLPDARTCARTQLRANTNTQPPKSKCGDRRRDGYLWGIGLNGPLPAWASAQGSAQLYCLWARLMSAMTTAVWIARLQAGDGRGEKWKRSRRQLDGPEGQSKQQSVKQGEEALKLSEVARVLPGRHTLVIGGWVVAAGDLLQEGKKQQEEETGRKIRKCVWRLRYTVSKLYRLTPTFKKTNKTNNISCVR